MSQQRLGRWATEAKAHLLKYRPKMAAQLDAQGKLDDWATKAAERARDQSASSIENGMFPLEAESEVKKNHMFLPGEEDQPELGADPNRLPDPASLVTTPGVNRKKRGPRKENALRPILSKMLLGHEEGTWAAVVRESLKIAGWVAMWRPMQIYLYDWWPLLRRSRIYSKLSHMPVELIQKGKSRDTTSGSDLPGTDHPPLLRAYRVELFQHLPDLRIGHE